MVGFGENATLLSEIWLPINEAARWYGCTRQCLSLQKNIGKIEWRKREGGRGFEVKIDGIALKKYAASQTSTTKPVVNKPLELSRLPARKRTRVMKRLEIIHDTKFLSGKELALFIQDYNARNPDSTISLSRVYDLRRLYMENGPQALVPSDPWNAGKTKIPDEVFERFKVEYLTERQPGVYSCLKQVLGWASRTIGNIDMNSFPSASTFMRRLKKECNDGFIFHARHGVEKWNRVYGYSIDRSTDNMLAGETWVCDHFQSDTIVLDEKGTQHCAWLTCWFDVKSQKLLGHYITLDHPSSEGILISFYRAACTHGIPTHVILDNGKDFKCKTLTAGILDFSEAMFKGLFCSLNIIVHFAWPYNPQAKICERIFGIFHSNWERHLNGYRGAYTTERPSDIGDLIKKGKLYQYQEYEKAFQTYAYEVYNRENRGGKTLDGRSPDLVWSSEYDSCVASGRSMNVTKEALEIFCTRISGPYTIRRCAVYDGKYGLKYSADWMIVHQGKKVYMRRDDRNMGTAWFYDFVTESYLGKSGLDGNVEMIVKTEIERSKLEEKIKFKRQVEKTTKHLAKVTDTNNDDVIANRKEFIRLANGLNGLIENQNQEKDRVRNYMVTDVDRQISEENRLRATGTYDLSALVPDMPPKKPARILELYGPLNTI